jgi:signal transduction histidine kinase
MENERLNNIIEMISSMARLDFSKRLETEISNDPIDLISYGLNMMSEELENNVVKKSKLQEINSNLEKFSYTVAHDLKSPLNTISGLISLIEMEIEMNNIENIKNYLNLLKETNDRSRKMINGILEYSKVSFKEINMHEIDLDKLFKESVEEHTYKKNVFISIENKLPIVYHNETALLQIINNLFSNAIKYNNKDKCEISVSCTEKGNHYEITIMDNGPGIQEDQQINIFNLFENQNIKQKDSTGIGLAIAKRILTETNGDIWVESKPNEYSKFVFTIQKFK